MSVLLINSTTSQCAAINQMVQNHQLIMAKQESLQVTNYYILDAQNVVSQSSLCEKRKTHDAASWLGHTVRYNGGIYLNDNGYMRSG